MRSVSSSTRHAYPRTFGKYKKTCFSKVKLGSAEQRVTNYMISFHIVKVSVISRRWNLMSSTDNGDVLCSVNLL
ncbi:hypothetical protein F2P81_007400 [Scophthalmus maximus]|uniref:Uncharacterized protein n=1 Tax=Scophthalmus maximus TaxID=52904 RepID=A0A6A4THB2_SCOMX|nr:hypothetical protein F2P81_007400 [Scophthalmus maximus]